MRRVLTTTGHWARWGYKILMLDVLFPLSVKKIVFVDADQIVRSVGRFATASEFGLVSTREYARVLTCRFART